MQRSNPAVIPRNHNVEEALEAAVARNDHAPLHRLLAAIARPYENRALDADLLAPAPPSAQPYRTFCGT